jgi:hypothetical protein
MEMETITLNIMVLLFLNIIIRAEEESSGNAGQLIFQNSFPPDGGRENIFIMLAALPRPLKEFVLYAKRNYYQFFYYADTRSNYRRREFSRLFC